MIPVRQTCSGCGEEKSANHFSIDARREPAKLRRRCKACVAAYSRQHSRRDDVKVRRGKGVRVQRLGRYGLTLDQYEEMCAAQGEACAICRTPFADLPMRPSIDHDHATGLVRGVLCNPCNTGLGMFRDNQAIMQRAMAYLNENR